METQPVPTPTHCPYDGQPILTVSHVAACEGSTWPKYHPCGHPAPVDRRTTERRVADVNHAQCVYLGIERRMLDQAADNTRQHHIDTVRV